MNVLHGKAFSERSEDFSAARRRKRKGGAVRPRLSFDWLYSVGSAALSG